MGTGYTRQSAATIVENGLITAADHNAEYNRVQSAFNGSTGHAHDGTTGNGPLLDLATSTTGIVPINRGGTGATTVNDFKTTLALNNVDNTSDANKPVSTAQAAAFDVHSKTAKTTPVDADEFGLADSAASFGLKRITWASIRTALSAAANTAILSVANIWTKPQRYSIVTISPAPTVTLNISDGANREITLNQNVLLANPSDLSSNNGQQFSITGQQDGSGGRTLSVGSFWYPIGEATMPAVPSGANAKFRIDAEVVNNARIDFKLSGVGV